MWKLFKLELYRKLSSNHLSKDRFSDDLMNTIDKCYKRHIDVLSGGGRLTPSPREKVVKRALNGLCKSNRLSRNPAGINIMDQLSVYIYAYWTMRVIKGPTGTTVVLFPGIFTPNALGTNYSGNAMDFIDALTSSLILHKSTMVGVTITHFPPAVTPWYGSSLLSFDEISSGFSLVDMLLNVLEKNLNSKVESGYLNEEDKPSILNTYSNTMNSIYNPIINLNNNIPDIGNSNVNAIFNQS